MDSVRGSGLMAIRDLHGGEEGPLLVVPRDMSLSLETVWAAAKWDAKLREVLEAVGDYGKSARGAILIFLLMEATKSCPTLNGNFGVSNPLTEYIKFLPHEDLPTFWTEQERAILVGTSLAPAVSAKLRSLFREFSRLRECTEHIVRCQQYWWDEIDGILTFDDWKELDAMYRSRALELPAIGDAMVPCIDMANHASGEQTAALYETDGDGNAILLLRDAKRIREGEEITITYGDDKGACEMIFSYGFIEDDMDSAKQLFLDLGIPDDDPLKRAKEAASMAAPGVRLFVKNEGTGWESDFIWLLCVNEEDGFAWRQLQRLDGTRDLEVSWKGERINDFTRIRQLLQDDELWDVFQLRAVTLLQDRVESQLRKLLSSESALDVPYGAGEDVRERPWQLSKRLRHLEQELLEVAYGDFEEQKMELVQSEVVQHYLSRAQYEEPDNSSNSS